MPSTIGAPEQTGLKPEAIAGMTRAGSIIKNYLASSASGYGKSMLLAQQGVEFKNQPKQIQKDALGLGAFSAPISLAAHAEKEVAGTATTADRIFAAADVLGFGVGGKALMAIGMVLPKKTVDIRNAIRAVSHKPAISSVDMPSTAPVPHKLSYSEFAKYETAAAEQGHSIANVKKTPFPSGNEGVVDFDVTLARSVEISDEMMAFKPGATYAIGPGEFVVKSGKLGSLVKHDSMYEFMPGLRNVNVEYATHRPSVDIHKPNGDVMPINTAYLLGDTVYVAKGSSAKKLLDVVTHEVQHRIQDKSLSFKGASIAKMESIHKNPNAPGHELIKKQIDELWDSPMLDTILRNNQEYNKLVEVPMLNRTGGEMQRIHDIKMETATHVTYMNTAGEVQARDTAARRKLNVNELQLFDRSFRFSKSSDFERYEADALKAVRDLVTEGKIPDSAHSIL